VPTKSVTPAEAGVQGHCLSVRPLDTGLRRYDDFLCFSISWEMCESDSPRGRGRPRSYFPV
jgi:hypothetical protein